MPMVGGVGSVKPADETVHEIIAQLTSDLRNKLSVNRPHLKGEEVPFTPQAVSYASQIVAGTNFFIKVKVTEGDFVHARVYRDLTGQLSLHSVAEDKKEEDEISYF